MKSKQSEYNNLNTVKPHWLDSILNSDTFQISLLITIVFHCILIALQTDDTHVFSSYPFKSRRYNSLLAGVRSIVSTINESVEDVVNITILVFAFTYFWANLGVVLYKNENPLDFGNVGAAYFTLFTAITQIGWIETFVQLRSKGFFISATIYFSTYFITVVFVISKIIVAVIVSNLEEFHKLAAESKRKRSRKLKSKKEALQGRIIRNLISMPGKDSKAWNSQVPFEVPDFDYISKVKVEHYATVLAIMEKNMEEYVQIVESLKEIQVEVKELNNAIEEKRVTEIQQLATDGVAPRPLTEGDALSRLLSKKSNALLKHN
ncbi:Cation channel sperm-associated protein 4 [Globomyces sp. JEL0801]|nr:Cation channel sperm-associated protein 4 [Globomyces sp. JEL0801]